MPGNSSLNDIEPILFACNLQWPFKRPLQLELSYHGLCINGPVSKAHFPAIRETMNHLLFSICVAHVCTKAYIISQAFFVNPLRVQKLQGTNEEQKNPSNQGRQGKKT